MLCQLSYGHHRRTLWTGRESNSGPSAAIVETWPAQTGGKGGNRTPKAYRSSDLESDAVTHRLAFPQCRGPDLNRGPPDFQSSALPG